MSTPAPGSGPARESFHEFFESWLAEQDRHLHDLSAATSSSAAESDNSSLQPLIDRAVRHYENYYRAKSRFAEQEVLSIFSPSWRSSLEEAFLWVGGSRPSMAFHLLYSKLGLQVESQLEDLIHGLSTGDLADLTQEQMARLDKLHRRTINEENKISKNLAEHQETAADTNMVELSHTMTDILQNQDVSRDLDRVEERGLQQILNRADDLRMSTIKGILEILSPIQGAHFLIAAPSYTLGSMTGARTGMLGSNPADDRRNQSSSPQAQG